MQLSAHHYRGCCLAASRSRPFHGVAGPPCASRPKPFSAARAPCKNNRNVARASASTPEASAPAPPSPEQEAKRQELLSGCYIILQELKGLDFSRTEARSYFRLVALLPKGVRKNFEFARARACLEQMLDVETEGYSGPRDALSDLEALQVTQATLSEIWRWRRRGGGMNDEDDSAPHVYALQDINRVEREDIDRITSSVLDTLPLTDKQKNEMAGSVQQVAMAGINSAVWGSMAGALALILLLNFVRF